MLLPKRLVYREGGGRGRERKGKSERDGVRERERQRGGERGRERVEGRERGRGREGEGGERGRERGREGGRGEREVTSKQTREGIKVDTSFSHTFIFLERRGDGRGRAVRLKRNIY